MKRRTMVSLALANLVALPAVAQDKHWLVGTWKGQLGNNFKGKDGPDRTMLIESVGPGSAVAGGWAATRSPKVGNAEFKLAGDTLTVMTGVDSQVELKRIADNKLRGQFRTMSTGKTFPIEMVRQ